MSDSFDSEKAEFMMKYMEKGYTLETADVLYYNYCKRKEILEGAKGRKLTDEEKSEFYRTRQYDKDIIEFDWKTNQPEKYALSYIKKLSIINNKIDAAKNLSDKTDLIQEKSEFMEKNKDWVKENHEVVKEVISQLSKPSTTRVKSVRKNFYDSSRFR